MLPLGVVIPTKNSMPYLPAHLEKLREWQDLAQEIVVVDSFSTDGTVDFLKSNLAHPKISFLSHPPGLYQSWNHGVAHISARHTYMSTTGDTIARAGIEKLVAAAESLAADVVISKPAFRQRDGQPAADISWPIDDIIATLGITTPRKLAKLEAMVFAAVHATGALLGSSASNLYRTEILRRLPFPTEFGTAGDGAWGLMHAAEATWVVAPGKFSTFLIHPTNASADEKKSYRESRRPDEVLRVSTERWLGQGSVAANELDLIRWKELLDCVTRWLDNKIAYDRLRTGRTPWSLNPVAWITRSRRNREWSRLKKIESASLRAIAASG
jgi:glycosyltransferase involved in cell wall biosynthesis